jgi:uncharacterized BrkB/YihY/UPF0761 family membrane protein
VSDELARRRREGGGGQSQPASTSRSGEEGELRVSAVGGASLFVTTVLGLTNVEKAFNKIWASSASDR